MAESFTAYSWWWQTRIYTHTHTNVRKGTKKKNFRQLMKISKTIKRAKKKKRYGLAQAYAH